MVNSGVIFFKLDSKRMQTFIQEWLKEIKICKVSNVVKEEYSLFNLIKKSKRELLNKKYNIELIKLANLEYRIKIFPPSIYNYIQVGEWYNDKKVKILHFVLMKQVIILILTISMVISI